jgi:L-ascorbate metabolism protein UlaG (beta-lactamase superfamily)
MAMEMLKNIQWLGHAGFTIKAGDKLIAIDPFQIDIEIPADMICITHSHYDHCSVPDINKIKKDSTVFITEPSSVEKLSGDVRTMQPGESVTVENIRIEAVPAYNTNKDFHPRENNWLGFIITINNQRIYHTGDTDLIPEMDQISADIALLPVSGTYVMTAEEAVEAAKRIKPSVAVPMHYDAIVGSGDDAMNFKNALNGIVEVAIL